jgi:hypothetical protein
MTRFQIRIVLLALGVVFGYGSAIAHGFGHHADDWHHHHDHDRCTESDAKSS